MAKRTGIILLSGGLDSTTLLWEYCDEIALAVSFDYGSKHNAREIAMARYQADSAGVEHIVIPLDFMAKYFRSDLLKNGGAIPQEAYTEDSIASTVVPFRNGIMLSIVAGLAESRGLDKLFIANHAGDHAIYPDCREEFILPMTSAIREGTCNHVEVMAPYTLITKTDILSRGHALGVDYAHTYSCYTGGDRHCGTCATCRERKEAFLVAGVADPTRYEA